MKYLEYQGENITDKLLDLSDYLQEVFDKFNIPNIDDPNSILDFTTEFGWYISKYNHITICNIPTLELCKGIYYDIYLIKSLITKRLNKKFNKWKLHIIEASKSSIRVLLTHDMTNENIKNENQKYYWEYESVLIGKGTKYFDEYCTFSNDSIKFLTKLITTEDLVFDLEFDYVGFYNNDNNRVKRSSDVSLLSQYPIKWISFNTKDIDGDYLYGFDIVQVEDEWYKVYLILFKNQTIKKSIQKCYICDQLEGLQKFIGDTIK